MLRLAAISGGALALLAALSCSALAQAAPDNGVMPCPSAINLIKTARSDAPGVTGALRVVSDDVIPVEGSFWSGGDSVVLPKDRPALRYDLGGVQLLKAFLLQGDNNEDYILEGSTDGVIFTPVWTAPPVWTGQGLRSRSVVLQQPVAARYLRVNPRGGDGFYSVSELQAYCQVPAAFPPKLRLPPKKYGWDSLDNDGMVQVKGVVATIAALLLLASFWRRFYDLRINSRAVRGILIGLFVAAAGFSTWLGVMADKSKGPEALVKFAKVAGSTNGWYYTAVLLISFALVILLLSMRKQGPRVFDTSLAVIGLFSFFAWWNIGHYHFDHYVHIWEHYHYIMGAKYGPELRYSRLYQCTAVADLQDGYTKQVTERKMRRIDTDNELGTTAAVIADPTICTKHFTDPARWEQFKKDIRFFRSHFSNQRWDESQQDHGYNATPVWGILGRVLADHTELTWDNIVKLGVIDSLFLIAMWIAVLWAFGWRAACVGLIYWGCNFPARFYWNGGSFLRYDWMLWMIVGICFMRKNRMALGGAALTYATLLRVFPGFVVATLVLKALAAMVRERRIFLSRSHQWFAVGCIATMAVLVPASSWATNGLDAWGEFAFNSKKHLATALTNNMGLKTVMGYDFSTRAINMRNDKLEDPFKEWKDAKHHFYHTRAPIFVLFLILFCVMLARAADREEEDWAAACLGTGLIVIGPELTCYYYGFLMTYGFLWPRRKLPGILAAALAAFTCFIYAVFDWNDDHFAAMSLASVVAVVAATAHAAFGRRTTSAPEVERIPPSKPPRELAQAAEREPSLPPILAEPR
ncbi:MAG TPA: discoidin domain-containing protein [Polyangiales bacterium]|nr:discoidin domain-containing protein [Polyangiales bacterium]